MLGAVAFMLPLMNTLGPMLGELFKRGSEFYKLSTERGEPATMDAVADHIYVLSRGWNPVVNGVTYIDDDGTRRAAARFLAGIVVKTARGASAMRGQP